MKLFFKIFIFLFLLKGTTFTGLSNGQEPILHAHNDYHHDRPLLDAWEAGFRSIEADVFSVGDSLFVAHDRDKITSGRTLRHMYLDPLKNMTRKINDQVILLVDIKDDGLKTYQLLHKILSGYQEMLTSYKSGKIIPGKVQVIVSGNRPLQFMQDQSTRYAFYDGRISQLDLGIEADLMPLVSDNWNRHFTWRGDGEFPAEERQKLSLLMQKAREKGYKLRFWATPERPAHSREKVWEVLTDHGVDLIGTDDLNGLKKFMTKNLINK